MPAKEIPKLIEKEREITGVISILTAKLAAIQTLKISARPTTPEEDQRPTDLESMAETDITTQLLVHLNATYRCQFTKTDLPDEIGKTLHKRDAHRIYEKIRHKVGQSTLTNFATQINSFIQSKRPDKNTRLTKTPEQLQQEELTIQKELSLWRQALTETEETLQQAKATSNARDTERQKANSTIKAATRARKAAQLKKNREGRKNPAKATQPDRTDNSLTPGSISFFSKTQPNKPIAISAFQLLSNPLNNLGIITSAYGTTPCMIIISFRLILLITKFISTKIHNLMRPGRDSITLLQMFSLPTAIIMHAQNKAHEVPDTLCLFSIAFLCVTHLMCRIRMKNNPMNHVASMNLEAKFIHILLTVFELSVLFSNTKLFTPGGEYQTKTVAPTAHA